MGDKSDIEWTDATWNPVRGCDEVSPGCAHCYAKSVAARFSGLHPGTGKPLAYHGLALYSESGKPRWTGEVRMVPEHLADPLRWTKPRRIFVNSMSDLFHEKLTDAEIAAVFGIMVAARKHTFQVLTKRAARMREWFAKFYADDPRAWAMWCLSEAGERLPYDDRRGWRKDISERSTAEWRPLPNVHLGVSVEDQPHVGRVADLVATPAAVRFVSYEPALSALDLTDVPVQGGKYNALTGRGWYPSTVTGVPVELIGPALDWVIVGGESGPGARPFDVGWARSVVEQCKAASVACFVKQMGGRPFERRAHGAHFHDDDLGLRNKKGGDMSEWPADLRVREFPR